MRFNDIGNLSIEEIDGLIATLIAFKRRGHFAGFWSSFAEAAQLMIANKVAIQSIWSPATVELERAGLKFRLARPREGYRAWFGGIGIIAALLRGDIDSASDALAKHLQQGEMRTRQRLKVLAVLPDPDLPGYMQRIA